MPVRVEAVESTDLFVGSPEEPHQLVRVILHDAHELAAPITVALSGVGVTTPHPVVVAPVEPGVVVVAEVATHVDGGTPGERRDVEVLLDGAPAPDGNGILEVAETGWTMVMVNHFHYDPVWWNTQAAYTSEWDRTHADGQPRGGRQDPGFALVLAHLEQARRDPDYTFVLAELDYLKPFRAACPQYRDELRALLRDGRCELMGGTYNEPNTNLTAAETTARNLMHGIGFQRDVLGGEPATAWQLDVFGHDPQFPGMCAAAGLTSSSWARGPFHQWGPMLTGHPSVGNEASVMQFPAEFEWISPGGRGLLTAYMADHYSAGWSLDSATDLGEAMEQAYRLFSGLKPVAAGRTVLLPVGTDYTPPNRWVTRIQREWNARYVWPRFVSGLPRLFFAAVRTMMAAQGLTPTPVSRDMNPLYTGKDVSYIDTKQAHRAGEQAVMEAERFATLATLADSWLAYPHAALDKAWRHLLFGAHHDAVTGSESDQVYLDLVTGWREALDLAADVRDRAQSALAARADTRHPAGTAEGDHRLAVTVFNGLTWPRTDAVRIEVTFPEPGVRAVELVDDDAPDSARRRRPVVVEEATTHHDGSLHRAVLITVARDVPGLGYRTLHLVAVDGDAARWEPADGTTASSDRWAVTADPVRGGALSGLRHTGSNQELIAAGELANELVVQAEYSAHPSFGEGPWHLVPTGTTTRGRDRAATVARERSAIGERLVISGEVGPVRYRQVVTVLDGVDRVDCRTTMVDFTGSDDLVRVRFGVGVDGGLPVSEVGDAVIGRGFGLIDVDSAVHPWTLDNPAYTWFGTSATAGVDVAGRCRAIGVAELVCPDDVDVARVRPLVVALVQQGVTATTSTASGSRYGLLEVDSNLPDVRIVVGGPTRNPFAATVLAAASSGSTEPSGRAGPAAAERLERQLKDGGRGRVWVPAPTALAQGWSPSADLRAPDALDVLILDGVDDAALDAELAAVVAELAGRRIAVPDDGSGEAPDLGPTPAWDGRTVALLNRGLPGFAVTPDGALHASLVRSCTGWPSGVWIDPPRRTAPDGSAFQLQHWTHDLEYALVAGDGDWRDADVVRHGQGYNQPLRAVVAPPHPGPAPATATLLSADPGFVLTTVKPHGNPLATGRTARAAAASSITVRGYDAHGTGGSVGLRLHDPLPALRGGRIADLLENPEPGPGAVLRAGDGAVVLPVGASDIVTAVLDLAPTPSPTSTSTPSRDQGIPPDQGIQLDQGIRATGAQPPAQTQPLGETAEPVQPVATRYWLHNAGTAPLGNLPVAVHVTPTRLVAEGAFELTVTVAGDLVEDARAGLVTLDLPPGWTARPSALPYELAPDSWTEHRVIVTPADRDAGRFLVGARISDDGQQFADHCLITLRPGPELPADRWDDRAPEGSSVQAGRVGMRLDLPATAVADGVSVVAGDEATVTAVLANPLRSDLHVQVWAISPYGTWDAIGPRVQGVDVPAGAKAQANIRIAPPPDATAGHTWLLLKAAAAGEILYSEAIRVVVTEPERRG
jgi:alpha-mannosidase